MEFRQAVTRSLRNVATHGDTDIFPLPFENLIFFDCLEQSADLLMGIHDNFEDRLALYQPFTINTLTAVGYTGFRWATEIDPFWNAYYLALVLALGDQIESRRLPKDEGVIFSYRYEWSESDAKLFGQSNWRDYRMRALELSRGAAYAVVTDVADFYPRIYHHRLENALERLPSPEDFPKRIQRLLSHFSKNVSYGLPIGGPASRLLAELALSPVDEHLFQRRVRFCRYADDYSIFCDTKEAAYRTLVLLADKLFNEGLVLQKSKTRILPAEEFREMTSFLDLTTQATGIAATEEQKLLNIAIRFDPYSATAEEDYDRLKAAVQEVDIMGILGRELAKTAIDSSVTKQAVNAIRALNRFARDGAIRTLLDSKNLQLLAPVFVTVMRTIKTLYDDLSDKTKDFVDDALAGAYTSRSHLLSLDLNLSYMLQVLSLRHSRQKESIFVDIFDHSLSPLVRRQVILAMARWKCFYWLTDIRGKYAGLSDWEKRAFIIASYVMGDEGDHWRRHVRNSLNPMNLLVRDWYATRSKASGNIPV